MPFGQVILGPPGSGKTTYCAAAAALMRAAGRRCAVVNLDPANDRRRQPAAGGPPPLEVDVMDLVCLESVMKELGLGPNGGLLYCVDHLAANLDWLEKKLRRLVVEDKCDYFLFDCPGQLELFTLSDAFKRVLDALTGSGGQGKRDAAEAAAKADAMEEEEEGGGEGDEGDNGTPKQKAAPSSSSSAPPSSSNHHHHVLGTFRLTAVQLLDAHLCADPSKYVAALVTALSAALRLELPHVAALSKADLLQRVGGDALDFRLDFYTEVQDLPRLARRLDDEAEVEEAALREEAAAAAARAEVSGGNGSGSGGDGKTTTTTTTTPRPLPQRRAFSQRYRKLTAGLCEVVQDYGLLSFTPLSVEDPASLRRLLHLADKASGALFAPLGPAAQAAAAAASQGAGPQEAARLAAQAARLAVEEEEKGQKWDGGAAAEGERRRAQLAAVAAAVAASGAPAEFLYGAAASGALPMAPDAEHPSEDYHERYVLGAWRREVEAARRTAADAAADGGGGGGTANGGGGGRQG